MSNFEALLRRNPDFAETGAHEGLAPGPTHNVLVVTCMDGRVDPAHILGVDLGEALVMRNAGGRVTEQVISEVAFLSMLAEVFYGDDAPPFEVAVIHHTGCGTGLLADDDFRKTYADRIGADEATLADGAVLDVEATVAKDVALLLSAPSFPARASASGHVYDVDTGLVTTIVGAAAAKS